MPNAQDFLISKESWQMSFDGSMVAKSGKGSVNWHQWLLE